MVIWTIPDILPRLGKRFRGEDISGELATYLGVWEGYLIIIFWTVPRFIEKEEG